MNVQAVLCETEVGVLPYLVYSDTWNETRRLATVFNYNFTITQLQLNAIQTIRPYTTENVLAQHRHVRNCSFASLPELSDSAYKAGL